MPSIGNMSAGKGDYWTGGQIIKTADPKSKRLKMLMVPNQNKRIKMHNLVHGVNAELDLPVFKTANRRHEAKVKRP